jgi:hypothetical protein
MVNSVRTMLLDTPSRDDVIEAAYLAMRVISHGRYLLRQGISPKAFLTRERKSSAQSRQLALRLVDEIVRLESAPLDEIPQQKLDSYIVMLSEAVRGRLKKDFQYDEKRARALLEDLRKAG